MAGVFRDLEAKARAAAVPACNAMTDTYKDHLVNVTLTESGTHGPVSPTPSAPGEPPAVMTRGLNGSLRESVYRTPAVGGDGVASAMVSPDTIYAVTQEYGGIHHGDPMWLWSGYIGHKIDKYAVDIPPRPYMSTAVRETIANGALARSAVTAFMAVVWGA